MTIEDAVNMGDRRVAEHDSGTDGLLVLCGLFAVFVALGVLRSRGWSLTSTVGEGLFDSVALVGYVLFVVLGGLFVWAAQAPERATYLLGGSAALGVFPAIPKLPSAGCYPCAMGFILGNELEEFARMAVNLYAT